MPDTRAARPDRDALVEVATGQHGYFTAAQANACGYSRSLLSHHARSGRLTRVDHGLYRITEFPPKPHEEVMAAWLAAGREETVVSHETALELLDLSDVIPDAIHITVPRSRRWYRGGPGVRIHTITRPFRPADIVVRDGIAVTSPARTIVDVARTGFAPDQLETVMRQVQRRGLATRRQLLEGANVHDGPTERLVRSVVNRVWHESTA
ncbi:MAG: type IV toxin-antitoxin system AbiEi family antitoxin domain-containing protein [Gemmatimonadota bacterium]